MVPDSLESGQGRMRLTEREVFWVGLMGGFEICVLVVGQKMVTKWYYNWPPGLILGALCTIFRARPVGAGLGAKFGRKRAPIRN